MTGESHYFEGRRYRIDVTERDAPPTVRLLNNTTMALSVRPGADRDKREAVLHQWYRHQLRDRLPALLAKMGTEGRRAGRRGSHQEDEDPLGDVQRRCPPNLVEP